MKIYIAGTFADQKALREVSNTIWSMGHEVVSTWLQESTKSEVMSDEEHKRKLAIKDLAELYAADLVILDNRQSSGGKNAEWGIGIGRFHHKLLWLVGEPTNVFHYLADKRFSNWGECLTFLREGVASGFTG